MQDENTTQTDSTASTESSVGTGVIEPTLSLGSNLSTQQDSASAASASDQSGISDDSTSGSSTVVPDADESADSSPVADKTTDIQPTTDSSQSGDLESIKASALEELSPIVNELDQEPEDKYRTLMMLIQASDDQKLIKDAYEAADKIEDKKAKAEA